MVNPDLIRVVQEKIKDMDINQLKNAGLINLQGLFFPSVHYPSITMYPDIDEAALFEGYQKPRDGFFDIYAHLPFCIKYCTFCHYPVKIGEQLEEKDKYLNALEKEIDIYANRLGAEKIRARSILIGGGTPTYLTVPQLERFLKFFTSKIDISSCSQFSYDVDPITISGSEGAERLRIMSSYGVDRLTIGIQSFDDVLLQKMNRHHNAYEAMAAVGQAKEAGFKLNIEFIYGYPEQTLDSWIDTLEKAVALDVDEIQLYRLKIIPYGDHEGFVVNKFGVSKEDFLSLEQTMIMKAYAVELLPKRGYAENLARVFSKTKEDFSLYANNQCCNLLDQIGFGLTAFSSLRDRFALNTQDFKEYYSLIDKGRLPINRGLVRNKDDQARWALILPLKNRDVHKEYYRKVTGESLSQIFRKKIEKLKKYSLLYEDEKTLMLTARGHFFADEVCHQFHHPRFMPFPKTAYNNAELCPYNDF